MLARRANSSGELVQALARLRRAPAACAGDLDGQRGQSMHGLLRRRGGGALAQATAPRALRRAATLRANIIRS